MDIRSVGIVGCGQMGSGIAEVCAKRGYDVSICEVDEGLLERGLDRIRTSMGRAVQRGKLSQHDMDIALGRIRGSVDVQDLANCRVVIEAVFEDLETKRRVFSTLDEVVAPGGILATNTSSISVAAIAKATQRGDKVVGLHFFNPVTVMKLVEVVPSVLTSPDTVETMLAFSVSLGKTAVLAKDSPGFIVNRLLVAYLIDAVRVYEQGLASKEDIDNAMRLGAAHPMGPLTLADFIGLDVVKDVADVFFEEYGEARFKAPPLLTRMVAAGHWGRKTGKGFYDYGS